MIETKKVDTEHSGPLAGLISLFVRHPTAANLLMVIFILLGSFSLQRLNTQFFPTIEIPYITVTIAWPGASSEDVEKNILDSLEPELRFLDNIDEVTSVAREGSGTIVMEFFPEADMQKALADVEQAVASVTTLPEDSEEPVISQVSFFERVSDISVSGDFPEHVLKAYAKQIRNGLLEAGIDKVTFVGLRSEEIWVRIREADLRRLNLTLAQISQRIREESRDLPSGTIEGDIEMQLRALSKKRTPEEIAEIEIKTELTGEKIRLKDIADIRTNFKREGKIGIQNGQRAIEMQVQRALKSDTLKTMQIMQDYIEKVRPTLPPTLSLKVYDVRGKFVKQRLGILIKNGSQGLAIVLVVLFIFLNWRIAFWVAAGIPIAFMATLFVMYLMDQSINMVSMFGLIMMLGIIVDDAIVVGEDTAVRREAGLAPIPAAEQGAIRMLKPVMAATLTTQVAFFPIFFVQDRIGDIMSAIPLVVTAVLLASIIECFLILPGHLRHSGPLEDKPGSWRHKFDTGMMRFREGPYRRFVEICFDWRYMTVASTVAILILCIGLIAGGRIGFRFFPSPEPEKVTAHVVFGAGTPRERQIQAMNMIYQALLKTEKQIIKDTPGEKKIVNATFTALGKSGRSQGENVAELSIQLTPSEQRKTPTKEITKLWRKNIPDLADVERVTLLGRRAGPPGRDIDVRLQDAEVETLKLAAEEVKKVLEGIPGVSAIADDLPWGKPELLVELNDRGRALGFTSQSVGTQLRNSFEGAIATRFARDDEEITVRVKRWQDVKGTAALNDIYLTSPTGQRVPLLEVITLREKRGFSLIQRRDGVRSVSVTADIDEKASDVATIVGQLRDGVMPELAEKYGLKYQFTGKDEERANSFADLKTGALLAMVLIYIILAWVFESYFKPLAVMAIIPFGLVGAILGHVVMGQYLTIITMFGLLGLTGILVNDSIILVSQIKLRLSHGDHLRAASIGASQDRLRAVLLTSLTTIGGLLPLLFETSRQAQFLIPMAITMVFGLATATILVLVLVPAIIGIGGDIGQFWQWYKKLGVGDDPERSKLSPAE